MALVYSYRRFSAKKQELGDSLRRQTEMADEWIARNGHTPATLALHDLGIPAFRGQNKHTGALGKFLELIGTGRIPVGSILLVEHLDRLSRQGIKPAMRLLEKIVEAGVVVAVLRPSEQLYTADSLNDPLGMIIPIIYFHGAYLESKNKSGRVGAWWTNARAVAEKDGNPINSRRPSWLDWDGTKFVVNKGADAIRHIFERTAEGCGAIRLVRELNHRFKPIGRSGHWNTSFIQKVLNDRAVLGERQQYQFDADMNRVAVGKPLMSYYPRIIDDSLWFRVQGRATRTHKGNPSGGFVNLWSGILFNANDGHPIHLQTSVIKGTVRRRLASYGHLRAIAGSDSVSVSYDRFESHCLAFLNEITPEDIEPTTSLATVQQKEQELAGIDRRLAELEDELTDPTSPLKSVRSAIAKLQVRRDELSGEIESLRATLFSDVPLAESKRIVPMLNDAADDEYRNLRLRLRNLIGELVESIYIKPENHYHDVYVTAQINFRSGKFKRFVFGPGVKGGTRVQVDLDEFRHDLRDRETVASVNYFAGVARAKLESAPIPPAPTEIPDTLGGAVDAWLATIRGGMTPATYRVIPPKIARLVSVLGADLPVSGLTGSLWGLWTKSLREDVASGRIARNSGRVVYSRSREFVRWMQEKGMVKAMDGLQESAEKVLAG